MQKLRKKATSPAPIAPLASDQLREVQGGGDIQARAFGAGKYGVAIGG